VISSRSEVFPNVLLEAVSAGVPVVATLVGGIPNISEGLKSVNLVEPRDPDALTSAMETALLSKLEDATEEARTHLQQRF
jgi:glycosyltransferase involved in cell wall biosynthesis